MSHKAERIRMQELDPDLVKCFRAPVLNLPGTTHSETVNESKSRRLRPTSDRVTFYSHHRHLVLSRVRSSDIRKF
jgi:hypothetical protein